MDVDGHDHERGAERPRVQHDALLARAGDECRRHDVCGWPGHRVLEPDDGGCGAGSVWAQQPGERRDRAPDESHAELERQALQWATWQNGRNGRTARQYVDHLTGKLRVGASSASAAATQGS